MSLLGFLFGENDSSSKSTSTSNTQSTWNNLATTEDSRQVLADGSIGASGGSSLAVNQDYSTEMNFLVNDSSSRDSSTNLMVNDSSNRSSIDPGSLKAMEAAMLSNTAISRDVIYATTNTAAAAANAVIGAADKALGKSLDFAVKNNSQLASAYSGALDFAARADAQQGVNFNNLLSTSYDMFKTNVGTFNNLVDDQFSSLASAQSGIANAYQTATAEKSGSIDNKTIMMIAIAAISAFALTKMR